MARNSTIRTRKIRGEDNLNGSISCAMAISAPHSTHNTAGPRRKEEGGLAAGHLWASIEPAFQRNLSKMLPPSGRDRRQPAGPKGVAPQRTGERPAKCSFGAKGELEPRPPESAA